MERNYVTVHPMFRPTVNVTEPTTIHIRRTDICTVHAQNGRESNKMALKRNIVIVNHYECIIRIIRSLFRFK